MTQLILLHGALGSAQDLLPLKKHLSPELQLHFFPFQGHAGKGMTGEFSIEGFSRELSEFILKNEILRPIVFGYSMGGYVALHLALSQPEVLGGIMTLGTKFDWNSEFTQKEIKRLNPKLMQEKVPVFTENLKKIHGPEWTLLMKRTATLMSSLEGTQHELMQAFHRLELPVWIGRGDRDKMVSMEESVLAFQNIKNSALYVLPDSGHTLDQVNMDLLAQHLISFIQLSAKKL